ncbi:MAG TPA: hypothetical protein VF088_18120 [Pyrinomonadaceae bacterium]
MSITYYLIVKKFFRLARPDQSTPERELLPQTQVVHAYSSDPQLVKHARRDRGAQLRGIMLG